MEASDIDKEVAFEEVQTFLSFISNEIFITCRKQRVFKSNIFILPFKSSFSILVVLLPLV